MKGQWIGKFTGATNQGGIIFNIESSSHKHLGLAILQELDNTRPSFTARIELEETGDIINGKLTDFLLINPVSFLPISTTESKKIYPNKEIPNIIQINGSKKHEYLKGSWRTNLGNCGEFRVNSSNTMFRFKTKTLSWEQYKRVVRKLDNGRYIFRGQSNPWPLRTSFHRHGRFNLIRYNLDDFKQLREYIGVCLNEKFNLNDPEEFGALLNVAQHNGYPTPLLDWTQSPYIAAFFAFADISKYEMAGKARLFIFDAFNWRQDTPQIDNILDTRLSLTLKIFSARHNPKALAQQSVQMFSNVQNVENFIKDHEKSDKKYLTIIDIPVKEREYIMKDLNYMGINASSMFPGIEGICKMLKETNF